MCCDEESSLLTTNNSAQFWCVAFCCNVLQCVAVNCSKENLVLTTDNMCVWAGVGILVVLENITLSSHHN